MKLTQRFVAGIILVSGVSATSLAMTTYAETNSVTTAGDVSFKVDPTPVAPVDPTDPDTPVAPTNTITPTPGPLSIDYASTLKFGEQKISAKDQIYYATFDTVKVAGDKTVTKPNWVQVTDKRGSNAGWKLQIKQNAQFSTSQNGVSKELKGAQITIQNEELRTTSDNQAPAPASNPNIKLTPGVAQDVMTAGEEKGMGTWVSSFGNAETGDKSISLSVPGVSEKIKDAKYTTELTWLLSDTPV